MSSAFLIFTCHIVHNFSSRYFHNVNLSCYKRISCLWQEADSENLASKNFKIRKKYYKMPNIHKACKAGTFHES